VSLHSASLAPRFSRTCHLFSLSSSTSCTNCLLSPHLNLPSHTSGQLPEHFLHLFCAPPAPLTTPTTPSVR
jgi:hypothetical protein